MATFVLALFDFFLFIFLYGGPDLRSSVPARLFARSKRVLQLRTAKP
jgi:hypothetical protein